jgi:hypothetical protein
MDSYTIAFGIRNVTDKDAALRDAYRVSTAHPIRLPSFFRPSPLQFTVLYLADPRGTAGQVLRPGGRLMVLEFSHVTVPGLREFYDAYSFNVIPAMGQLVANDRDSYQYLVESIRKFPPQVRARRPRPVVSEKNKGGSGGNRANVAALVAGGV